MRRSISILAIIALFFFQVVGIHAATDTQVSTKITQVQSGVPVGTPSAPSGMDQKGFVGEIIANIFDTSAGVRAIKNVFIVALRNLGTGLNNNVPKWNGNAFVQGTITDRSGNIGIGNTNPTQKLDVVGSIRASSFVGDGASITNINGDSIQDGTIDGSEIQNNTLTANDIAPDAIGSSELANNSVASANIVDSSIQGSDILNNTITESDIDNAFVARNSQLLDGYNSSQTNIGNTVAVRNSSGDINARLFRSEFDSTNSNVGYIMTQIETASNNYVRPTTPAQFRSAVTDSSYINIGSSGDQIQNGTIDGSEIQDNTLTASDIASNAIGNSELADGSVDSGSIKNYSITGTDIAANTLTAGKIAANSINGSELNSTGNFAMGNIDVSGVIKGKFACRVVDSGFNFPGNSTARCASNEFVMSGGAQCYKARDDTISLSRPLGDLSGWTADCSTYQGNNASQKAYAICCDK